MSRDTKTQNETNNSKKCLSKAFQYIKRWFTCKLIYMAVPCAVWLVVSCSNALSERIFHKDAERLMDEFMKHNYVDVGATP